MPWHGFAETVTFAVSGPRHKYDEVQLFRSGVFGSRRIEQSSYDIVPVRVLCADAPPDHDTICTFRPENKELVGQTFVKVLEMAHKGKGERGIGTLWPWVSRKPTQEVFV